MYYRVFCVNFDRHHLTQARCISFCYRQSSYETEHTLWCPILNQLSWAITSAFSICGRVVVKHRKPHCKLATRNREQQSTFSSVLLCALTIRKGILNTLCRWTTSHRTTVIGSLNMTSKSKTFFLRKLVVCRIWRQWWCKKEGNKDLTIRENGSNNKGKWNSPIFSTFLHVT